MQEPQETTRNRLEGVKVGLVFTGSHCTMGEVVPQISLLKQEGADIYNILSYTVDHVDTRFYKAQDLKEQLKALSDHPLITTIVDAEPIGPQKLLDIVALVPATGNTIAKLANGIVDTPALMAVKAQLRNQRPVVIAISTNDALSMNAKNIGSLLNTRNIYFVPFRQDDPFGKASSAVACMDLLADTIVLALQGRQIQPLLMGPRP
ncbi:MAG TPA: dipicolinate synthase subunit B [Syntrophomonadaceae bacterium]|nr:dipicolinate synthase subunit B [Syntrophomonadaceae bacterium]